MPRFLKEFFNRNGVLVGSVMLGLVLFWTIALYCGSRILADGQPRWWYALGVALGLGLLGGLLAISDRRYRTRRRRAKASAPAGADAGGKVVLEQG